MDEVVAYIQNMSSGDFTLLIALVFLLALELAVRKHATRKPPLF